jgi:DNA-binding beta-propeller fold protein YncE
MVRFLLGGLVSVTAACGGAAKVAVPLPSAPEPAVSPAPQADLPGSVMALEGAPEGIAIIRSGTVAVSVRDPNQVVLFELSTPTKRRIIPLSGSARHLFLGGPDGPLLIPQESDDRFVALGLPAGQVLETVPVGRQPHDSIAVGPDTVFVADELADTIHIVRNGAVTRVVPAPIQPGGMASAPDGSVMVTVGVRGRRITAYRNDGSIIGTANCGAGPTHAVTGSDGLYWVVDTNGGAILGFRVDRHGPRQVARLPVGAKPYGIAYDERRSTLWITLTGTNQLVGLHLDGTAVTSRATYATVQQPNTVAVDDASGEVILTGSTPHGALQFITPGTPATGAR